MRRFAAITGMLVASACSTAEPISSRPTPSPIAVLATTSPSAPPRAVRPVPIATVTSRPPIPTSTPTPTPKPESPPATHLLVTFNSELRAVDLRTGTAVALGPVGEGPVLSPAGRYVASLTARGLIVHDVRRGRTAALLPAARSYAFSGDEEMVVARDVRAQQGEGDCGAGTAVSRVRLSSGTSRPVARFDHRVVAVGATSSDVLLQDVTAGCDEAGVSVVRLATGRRTSHLAVNGLLAVDPSSLSFWTTEPRHGEAMAGRTLRRSDGTVLARTSLSGDAAFGPGGLSAYSDDEYRPGTYVPWRSTVRVLARGTGRPLAQIAVLNEGNIVWDRSGAVFALRRAADSSRLEAVVCVVASAACRPVPLRWSDEVVLLGLLGSADFSA